MATTESPDPLAVLKQAESEAEDQLRRIRGAIGALSPADRAAPARRARRRRRRSSAAGVAKGNGGESTLDRTERVLAAHGQISRAELIQEVGATPPAVDNAVARLSKAGRAQRPSRGQIKWKGGRRGG